MMIPTSVASSLPLLLLAAPALLAYFFQVRPRRRRARAVAVMQDGLAVGDQVVTAGGLHGIVVARTGSTVDLEVCSGTCQRYDLTAIARLQGDQDPTEAPGRPTGEGMLTGPAAGRAGRPEHYVKPAGGRS